MNKSHFIFLLLILFACTKEEGFIPGTEEYEAHYHDLKPELSWAVQWEGGQDLNSMAAHGNRLITTHYGGTTFIFDTDSGKLLNEFDASIAFPGFDIDGPIQLAENGNDLYLIESEHPRIFKIDKSQGALLEVLTPYKSASEYETSSQVIRIENEVFFLSADTEGKFFLTLFDFTSNEETEITIADSLELSYSFFHRMAYSDKKNLIYVLSKNRSDQFKLFTIHPETGEIDELLNRKSEYELDFPIDLTLNDKYVFAQLERKIFCFDIQTNEMIWPSSSDFTKRAKQIFVHLNSLYVNHHDRLLKIDPATGNQVWTSKFFSNGSHESVPNEEFAVSIIYQPIEPNSASPFFITREFATIYQLTDGKRLVEWQHPENDPDISGLFRQILYHENNSDDKSIFLTTDNTICKYQWPF